MPLGRIRRPLLWFMLLFSFLHGWGYEVHRRINKKAAEILTGDLGEFTKQHAQELALYAPVADFIKDVHRDEHPRHYLDADLYGEYPFRNLEVDYEQLLASFGKENIESWGSAPWSIGETADILVKMFKQQRWEEAVFYMGYLGHYVADIHMPLHACANYNGQNTGNEGVHFRWESRMVDELIPDFAAVGEIQKINDMMIRALDITKDSFLMYPRLLEADHKARATLTPAQIKELNSYKILPFEEPYLRVLYAETEDIILDRLGQSAVLVASYWYTCWLKAGSPSLPK